MISAFGIRKVANALAWLPVCDRQAGDRDASSGGRAQVGASFIRLLNDGVVDETEITRLNVLRPLGTALCQPARKSDPRCVCADPDFIARYNEKVAVNRGRVRCSEYPQSGRA
jgi:hypothetical protein